VTDRDSIPNVQIAIKIVSFFRSPTPPEIPMKFVRKKVVETKKDSTIHQISMPYITNFIGISNFLKSISLLKSFL
jgi:hypothetical protein